ncbi:hypothetical protein [Nonomuraea sp. NPDC050783]|uniref:hypothetical protein n=1 Tax=Nonomuraea sp. NPDC050783 TaxID=3154634 RepID=UPI003467EBEC
MTACSIAAHVEQVGVALFVAARLDPVQRGRQVGRVLAGGSDRGDWSLPDEVHEMLGTPQFMVLEPHGPPLA